jgi:hypothetical protein
MARSVNLRLSEFTLYALVGERRSGIDEVGSSAIYALHYYLDGRNADAPNRRCPEFLPDVEGHGGVGLELTVDDDLWNSLEREAELQGVSPAQLVEHAALYFAARRDAGDVTQFVLDDLDS